MERIDAALQRYYQSLNTVYDEQFALFCQTNGYNERDDDDDPLQDELDEDPSDCMLPDAFDIDTFPFNHQYKDKTENEKHEFIYSLIKRCDINPNIQFLNGTQAQSFQNTIILDSSSKYDVPLC